MYATIKYTYFLSTCRYLACKEFCWVNCQLSLFNLEIKIRKHLYFLKIYHRRTKLMSIFSYIMICYISGTPKGQPLKSEFSDFLFVLPFHFNFIQYVSGNVVFEKHKWSFCKHLMNLDEQHIFNLISAKANIYCLLQTICYFSVGLKTCMN